MALKTPAENFGSYLDVRNPPSFFFRPAEETETEIVSQDLQETCSVTELHPGFKTTFLMKVFSFYNGSDLLHICSRLSKSVRANLIKP